MTQIDTAGHKTVPVSLGPLQLVIESLAALPIAVTAALYSVSFAVIVYGGSLSPHLDLGIFLTLLGSGVAAITTGLFGSLRGAIAQAQDATAILLAGTIAPVVVALSASSTPEVQFATAVALVATTTILTGVLIYLSGVFRMSFTARFIPYPMISGLLVSIGYLLSMSSINLVIRQPVDLWNLPAKSFKGKSIAKSKYADAVVEMDSHVGQIVDKVRELGIANNTFVVYTVDNGAWQDVYPDSGCTPFRSTKGTDREGGSRVPALAWWPGKIKPGSDSHDIVGGLDLMATFAAMAGLELPKQDRDGKPMVFDSYDLAPVLFGTGKSKRDRWFYFTEDELSPGAIRVGRWKAVFNLRGDDGAVTGSKSVDTNLGWKGPSKYTAGIPQIFDLLADPQERYDLFMTNFAEKTWTMPIFNHAMAGVMKSFVEYPPRKLQSEIYTGPMTIARANKLQHLKELLQRRGIELPRRN